MKYQQPKHESGRIQAKRSLGQNFLTDKHKAQQIATLMDATEGDTILEIGPGCGDLTGFLLKSKANVHAIELDERAIETLHDIFDSNEHFSVEYGDFLKFKLREYAQNYVKNEDGVDIPTLKVAGNIPYYITSDILFRLFEQADVLERAVIMMQKEVAERICAKPRTKQYGILSIAARFVSEPRIALKVPSGCFTPRPSVDSAVVVFDFTKRSISMQEYTLVHPLVRMAFGQRRKILSNALSQYLSNHHDALSMEIQTLMSKRAEELIPDQFMALAKCFSTKEGMNNQ
ncbi:MAG: 16S rRNA (adenine(1518)-N(6)/adenine(1519)-N(6))-dimethyltransferase RsmA [Candidatus Kapaibacteriota bacterium]